VVIEDTEIRDSYLRQASELHRSAARAGFVGNQAGARQGFGPIDIDRSCLADALALFDDIIETFPVRGDIPADLAAPPRGVNFRPALR
jgi:hypothetical protein